MLSPTGVFTPNTTMEVYCYSSGTPWPQRFNVSVSASQPSTGCNFTSTARAVFAPNVALISSKTPPELVVCPQDASRTWNYTWLTNTGMEYSTSGFSGVSCFASSPGRGEKPQWESAARTKWGGGLGDITKRHRKSQSASVVGQGLMTGVQQSSHGC